MSGDIDFGLNVSDEENGPVSGVGNTPFMGPTETPPSLYDFICNLLSPLAPLHGGLR